MKPLNVKKDENGKVVSFDIDRKFWYRGQGGDDSRLLRPNDAKMCYLGFACLAFGLSPNDLEDISWPSELFPSLRPEWPSFQEETDIGTVNDAEDISDATREHKIQRLFAKQGITVNFV